MNIIHPTAIVDPQAQLGDNIKIGPYCTIGPNVVLGDGNELVSHVVMDGHTTIGNNNKFFPFCSIGMVPQDLKYSGEPTRIVIGDNNHIRECVTIHLSANLNEDTTVGNNNLIMAYAHIAHNCHVGSNVIMANSVNLAGHVTIEDFVTIGGVSAVHQFVKIGAYSFIGGTSGVKKDVPPYTRGQGMGHYRIVGLNFIGLQRKGFSNEVLEGIKKIYRLFYQSKYNVAQALEEAEKIENPTPEQKRFIEFVRNSSRGICRYNKD